MTSSASKLAKCSSAQLKSLAELVGVNTTATKTALVQSLQGELLQRPHIATLGGGHNASDRPSRILSIDMGIRNLAFCVLEVNGSRKLDPQFDNQKQDLSISDIENAMQSTRSVLDTVKLVAWKRTSLFDLLEADGRVNSTSQSNSTSTDADLGEDVDATAAVALAAPPTPAIPKEAFDPATFARLTYKLVTRIFLPYNVSHVLIERQRYRSGSAPAIMEWTVRVNMLESMLHAVFGTLRREASPMKENAERPKSLNVDLVDADSMGQLPAERDVISQRWSLPLPRVHSISPRKVALFWGKATSAPSKEENIPAKKRPGAKVEKEAKIAIAETFLTEDGPRALKYSPEAEEARTAFLAVRNRRNGGRSSTTDAAGRVLGRNVSAKLDDLADCLLQGAAWAQWEMNRSCLRAKLQQVAAVVDETSKRVTQTKKKAGKKKTTKTKKMEKEEKEP